MLSGNFFLEAAARSSLHLNRASLRIEDLGLDFKLAAAKDSEGQGWVLLSPREPEVLAKAETERCILKFVGGKIPAQVPDWRIFTPELIAYPCIAGRPTMILDKTPHAKQRHLWQVDQEDLPLPFLESLSENLHALHALNSDEGAAAGVPVFTPVEARRALAQRIENCRQFVDIHESWLRRWHAWLADDEGWPDYVAMAHGDLQGTHLLLGEDNRISGILDWAHARFTDPAVDLAMIYRNFGAAALDFLLDRYAKLDVRAWPGMRAHAIEWASTYPIALAEFGALSGKNQLLEEARSILSHPFGGGEE
jgi:macrolide phosphotransferase